MLPNLSALAIGADADPDGSCAETTQVVSGKRKRPVELPDGRLVAHLLHYEPPIAGSQTELVDGWGKQPVGRIINGVGPHVSSPHFTELIERWRNTTIYPDEHQEHIRHQNLWEKDRWEQTNLFRGQFKPPDTTIQNPLYHEISEAQTRFENALQAENMPRPPTEATNVIEDGCGYYLRKDLSKYKIYCLGDTHGSLHSFIDIFLQMHTDKAFDKQTGHLKATVAVVCTGDILDRSPYTLECLYLILRLQRENPQQVFLTAGNHERSTHSWVCGRPDQPRGKGRGSACEMQGEYGKEHGRILEDKLKALLWYLPASLIAKTKIGIVQFNHGAFEEFAPGTGEKCRCAIRQFAHAENYDAFSMMSTLTMFSHNQLQWGDLVSTAVEEPPKKWTGRTAFDTKALQTYLRGTGIRMIIRGHSDQANLSLVYGNGSQPDALLQEENTPAPTVLLIPWKVDGKRVDDQRFETDSQSQKGNTFVLNMLDYNRELVYDMWTLEMVNQENDFVKNIIRLKDQRLQNGEDTTDNILAVTVASCIFSKPAVPHNTMSAYLVLGGGED